MKTRIMLFGFIVATSALCGSSLVEQTDIPNEVWENVILTQGNLESTIHFSRVCKSAKKVAQKVLDTTFQKEVAQKQILHLLGLSNGYNFGKNKENIHTIIRSYSPQEIDTKTDQEIDEYALKTEEQLKNLWKQGYPEETFIQLKISRVSVPIRGQIHKSTKLLIESTSTEGDLSIH